MEYRMSQISTKALNAFINKVDISFLSKYCNISPEEASLRIQPTIDAVKSGHHVYQCIERAMFTVPRIDKHPQYFTHVKSRFPNVQLLELGCCFGTDARKFLQDGLPEDKLTVSDLHDAYWNIGKTILYKDALDVDVLFLDFADKISLRKQYDIISNQMILHVLSKQQVEQILKNCFTQLNKNGFLFGSCIATKEVNGVDWGKTPTLGLVGRAETSRYLHSKESLSDLLKQIGFFQIDITEDTHWRENMPLLHFAALKNTM